MQLPRVEHLDQSERGSAIIEFLLFGILLLVPLALGMVDVSNYFNALMAGQSAAREAARSYSLSPSPHIAETNAHAIALQVLADSGVQFHDFRLRVVCSADPCLTPGASVRALVDFRTDLRVVSRAIHVEEKEPIDSWVMAR